MGNRLPIASSLLSKHMHLVRWTFKHLSNTHKQWIEHARPTDEDHKFKMQYLSTPASHGSQPLLKEGSVNANAQPKHLGRQLNDFTDHPPTLMECS